eukprot:gene4614-3326_t
MESTNIINNRGEEEEDIDLRYHFQYDTRVCLASSMYVWWYVLTRSIAVLFLHSLASFAFILFDFRQRLESVWEWGQRGIKYVLLIIHAQQELLSSGGSSGAGEESNGEGNR